MSTPLADSVQSAPGLPHLFACCIYDAMLTIGVLLIASALAVLVNHGESIPPGSAAFQLYLLAAAFPYFGYCWTRGGQTLGMRAWGVRLTTTEGRTASAGRALLRYLMATVSLFALGAGFLWILIDRERRSWHDIVSGTRLRKLPR